ncbi:MAG: PEP-CTERM sorting domain-containing protein [Desulfobaccales bacterium]
MKKMCYLLILIFISIVTTINPVKADTIYYLWQFDADEATNVNYLRMGKPADNSFDFILYIFTNINDLNSYLKIMDTTQKFSYIHFTNENGIWYAGDKSGDKDLSLGNSPQFYIAFYYNGSYIYQYDIEGGETNYLITVSSGDLVDFIFSGDAFIVETAAPPPVPLPGSALLLGSGLLGLALVWRRQQRRR